LAVTEAAVLVKVAVVAPAATVREAGTGRAALLLDSATVAPPPGATTDKLTMHVEVEPDTTLAGEHCRVETVGSGVTVTAAVAVLPLRDAVTVAD
jgi:hypothetical protein